MSINVGIILNSMEIGQLPYEVITQINTEILSGSNLDYRIFFENVSMQCVNPLCSVQNISEIWGYSGILISTTLDNTLFSLKLKTDVLRVFYIWDMEWLRKQKNYLYNLSILRHPKLILVSRSVDSAKELERYSNRSTNFITTRLSFKDLTDKILNEKCNTANR
jgi:hypothetical protein